MGQRKEGSAGHTLLYRGLNHGRMREVCKALNVPLLRDAWRKQLGRDTVSQNARDFATDFVALQEARHAADYDPRAVFLSLDVSGLIETAGNGLAAFGRMVPDEQADVLALMLVSSARS